MCLLFVCVFVCLCVGCWLLSRLYSLRRKHCATQKQIVLLTVNGQTVVHANVASPMNPPLVSLSQRLEWSSLQRLLFVCRLHPVLAIPFQCRTGCGLQLLTLSNNTETNQTVQSIVKHHRTSVSTPTS